METKTNQGTPVNIQKILTIYRIDKARFKVDALEGLSDKELGELFMKLAEVYLECDLKEVKDD